MLSFENFVKSMPPSLSELKVMPSFCFAFKIPDNVTATKFVSTAVFCEIDYNSLTYFEYEANAITGNGKQVN